MLTEADEIIIISLVKHLCDQSFVYWTQNYLQKRPIHIYNCYVASDEGKV